MLNNTGIPLKNCNKNKAITYIPMSFLFLQKSAFNKIQCPLNPSKLTNPQISILSGQHWNRHYRILDKRKM